MQFQLTFPEALSAAQLRAIHALWHRWVRPLGLTTQHDAQLRHYYISLFSGGRASQSNHLSKFDAVRVISWLEQLSGAKSQDVSLAAGTAGRRGFPQRRSVRPDAAAWRALWTIVRGLGWNRAELEGFIHRHYGNLGLRTLNDFRSMADLNRVLWGLKAILRRRTSGRLTQRKAA